MEGRCAGCKLARKGCEPDCPLRGNFPASESDTFSMVKDVFTVENVKKRMRELQTHDDRLAYCKSVIEDASNWFKDPICGPAGVISRQKDQIANLEVKIMALREQLAAAAPNLVPAPALAEPDAAVPIAAPGLTLLADVIDASEE